MAGLDREREDGQDQQQPGDAMKAIKPGGQASRAPARRVCVRRSVPFAMPGAPRQPARSLRQRIAKRLWFDDSIPTQVRRANHLAMLAIVAAIPIAVTMLVHDFTTTGPSIASAWYILLQIAMFGGIIYFNLIARRVVRRAAAASNLLCPNCAYDLRDSAATGTCPECGRAYEHEAVRAQWLDAERQLKRK